MEVVVSEFGFLPSQVLQELVSELMRFLDT